jgi:hydroxyethylthiazole kinase-like uncharacterized protein yjeF
VRAITDAMLRRWPLPRLDPKRGKVARGSLLVVGGSDENPGAAMLAGIAGLRAGAGTLTVATSARHAGGVATALPEARVIALATVRGQLATRAMHQLEAEACATDALVLGPGMTDGRAGTALRMRCARAGSPRVCVVDAGPLTDLVESQRGAPALILTPHPGEMAALCGLSADEVLARPLELARDLAAQLDAVVALKGDTTYVAAPDGTAFRSTAGGHGLGTSGSGDVLSGVIGGLCARGAEPLQAAVWAVHLHGRAGDALARRIGPLGYLARELPGELPALLARSRRRR